MRMYARVVGGLAFAVTAMTTPQAQSNQTPSVNMTFFVTSVNPGQGGDFGGLAGADAHCQKLAAAVSSGKRQWRAYLSAGPEDGRPGVNARDRIGRGPWVNAKGQRIAANVADLHSENSKLGFLTAFNENGDIVPRSKHDILTGSNADGTYAVSRTLPAGIGLVMAKGALWSVITIVLAAARRRRHGTRRISPAVAAWNSFGSALATASSTVWLNRECKRPDARAVREAA